MTDFKRIEFEVKNNVAYIRLNQPEILNAMSADMGQEIMLSLIHISEPTRPY